MTLDELRYALDAQLSMAPQPWAWHRDRIECANGNEIFPAETIDYLNMIFEQLPKLLAVAEAAQRYFTEDFENGDSFNPRWFNSYSKVKEALAALDKQDKV